MLIVSLVGLTQPSQTTMNRESLRYTDLEIEKVLYLINEKRFLYQNVGYILGRTDNSVANVVHDLRKKGHVVNPAYRKRYSEVDVERERSIVLNDPRFQALPRNYQAIKPEPGTYTYIPQHTECPADNLEPLRTRRKERIVWSTAAVVALLVLGAFSPEIAGLI